MFDEYRIKEGDKVSLISMDTRIKHSIDKDEMKKKTKDNIKEMVLMQQKLYASSEKSLLVVLQAIDAGGKDGTIRKVFGAINPQGCRVSSFKVPTALESAHDFLWRIHKEVPKRGMIRIFNRSHYESVLIERVHKWISKEECMRRYGHIRNFEQLLSDYNTKIIKFYLHISKDEQKKRFQERIDIKEKNWKFSSGDLKERDLFETYVNQFADVFEHTSTEKSPWYVIPADDKKFRNYVISSVVRKTMEDMDLKFPPPEEGLDKIVIK